MTALMSLKEAARMVGKSEVTLRALIRAGKIKASKDTSGIYQVNPNDVTDYYSQSKGAQSRVTNRSSKASATPQPQSIADQSPLIEALQAQIRLLERELEHSKSLLANEQAARNRLEQEMSAVLREIQAMLEGQNEGVLSRFFQKRK